MIRSSEELDKLAPALATAQAGIPIALKSATGQVGQQKTKYADLTSIRETIRGPLANCGLSYVQFPASALPGYVRVITRVLHESGQWIEDDEGLMLPSGATAQSYGSALTYAKRYGLCAAFGVVADEDDDGHAASQQTQGRTAAPRAARGASKATEPPRTNTDPNMATDAQCRLLAIQCDKAGIDDAHRHEFVSNELVGRPIKSFHDLTKSEISKAIDDMQARNARSAA